MNQGLEILIARTKTHPQEFIGHELYNATMPKWVLMVQNFTKHMTDNEKEKWQEAMTDLNKWHENKRRDDFTEEVMKELLVREGEEEIGAALYSMSHPKKPRPKQLLTIASITNDALAILATAHPK
jgi:hypothetical protein